MKRTFEMNGKKYNSMMDIARDLGIKRVYPRDFSKYNIVETTGQETVEAAQKVEEVAQETAKKVEETVQETAAEEVKTEEVKTEEVKTEEVKTEEVKTEEVKTEEVKTEETKTVEPEKNQKETKDEKTSVESEKKNKKVDHRFTRKVGTPEEIQEVQDNVGQMTLSEFNAFVKHFSVKSLVQMAEAVGVDTWKSIDNEPIKRMRLLMGLKGYYFPGEKTPAKPNKGWRKVELDDLVKLAKSRRVKYRISDNRKIQRMYIVTALNKAGLTPDDIVTKEDTKKNA